MDTTESNKLINLWMAEFEEHESDRLTIINDLENKGAEPGKYHKGWELLMPVAKRCYECQIFGSNNLINDIKHALAECDIEEAYKAIITFIEFYNENRG